MATECEKSVQALVTHLRAPISQSNAAVSQKATTTKTVSPLVSVSDDDSGCGGSSGGNGEHILYEWCPENLTSDQVSAYFSGKRIVLFMNYLWSNRPKPRMNFDHTFVPGRGPMVKL